jgi:hypothetical protein
MAQRHLHGSKDTLQSFYVSCMTVDTVGKKIALNSGDWICLTLDTCGYTYIMYPAQEKIAKNVCLLKNMAIMYLNVFSPLSEMHFQYSNNLLYRLFPFLKRQLSRDF